MNRTLFFGDKSVVFTREVPTGQPCVVVWADDGGVSRTNVTKILETANCVAVVSADPEAAFAAFSAQFAFVEAGGGVVVNDRGEWLMIRRKDRWDFPKGHLECGECIEECAAREIAEETGVCGRVVRPLCETFHAYWFPKTARWELKRTRWFELHTAACDGLRPQTEEGIERVTWCTPAEVESNLREAFPTIRCVAAAMREKGVGKG